MAQNDPVGKMVPNRRIKVTEEDIAAGTRQDQWNCAIAESIKRQTPGARRVLVNKNRISYSIGEERITYPTPPAAIEAVIKPFDLEGKAEPITLNLVSGTAEPRKYRDEEEEEKHVGEQRDYQRDIRKGERPEPPSMAVRHGTPTPQSRTWNRFVDQEKRVTDDNS